METKTKGSVQDIREAFDRLADAMSTGKDGIVDRVPKDVGDEWDALLDAIEKAEGRR